MFHIVSVKGDSVRVRCGLIVIDVKVLTDGEKKRIQLPEGTRVDNFRTLVGLVFEAYEHSIERENVPYEGELRRTG